MLKALLLVGVVGALASARTSYACLTPGDPELLRTTPPSGSNDVPTDVAILIDLSQAGIDSFSPLPEGFAVLRTADGELVPSTTERVAWWHAEVRPAEALAPETSYDLDVLVHGRDAASEVRTATFTTGAGPLDIELGPLKAALQHWAFAPDVPLTSCDPPPVGTCVALPAGALVEALLLKADRTGADAAPYLYTGSFSTDLTLDTRSHPYRCVRLRERALNGSYGEATVLCSEDAPTAELSGNASFACSATGILHDDAPAAQSGSTEGDAPPPQGSSSGDGASADSAADEALDSHAQPEAGDGSGEASLGCALRAAPAPATPLGVLAALALAFWRRRRQTP